MLEDYALEALDAGQSSEVRAHLENGCAACNAELAEIEAALAQLPLTLDAVVPPARLRAHLMEKVRISRMPLSQSQSHVAQTPARRRWAEPLIAAAAAAAITAGVLWVKLDRQQRQLDAVRDELARQEARVDQLQAGLDNDNSSIRMFVSPAVQLVSLEGTGQQPAAKARVYWDEDRNIYHLYVAGLKEPPPGKTYEMWFINSEQKKLPAGTFSVGPQGDGSLQAKPPADAGKIVTLAITDEPVGGSSQPTGQIQLKSKAL